MVGLRAFVLDDLVPDSAEEGRKADWKLINTLRNDLMHGLVDPEKLANRPHLALLAAMHYLHDSICVLSHASYLAGEQYLLARGGSLYLFCGTYKALSWQALQEWGPVIEVADFACAPHDQYGFVPQVDLKNDGLEDLRIGFATLGEPFSFANMNSIRAVRPERE